MFLRMYDNGRFLVSSLGYDWYLVDLNENKGKGWCACDDFEKRCQPRINKKEAGRRSCKHLDFARLAFKIATERITKNE